MFYTFISARDRAADAAAAPAGKPQAESGPGALTPLPGAAHP
jgi:hypothetical protein